VSSRSSEGRPQVGGRGSASGLEGILELAPTAAASVV
jgi:hypothetical protein